MFGVDCNQESEKIIPESMKNIKMLVRLVLCTKTFMFRIPSEEAFNGLMRKYK